MIVIDKDELAPCGKAPKSKCPVYYPTKYLCSGEIYPYCDAIKMKYRGIFDASINMPTIIKEVEDTKCD